MSKSRKLNLFAEVKKRNIESATVRNKQKESIEEKEFYNFLVEHLKKIQGQVFKHEVEKYKDKKLTLVD